MSLAKTADRLVGSHSSNGLVKLDHYSKSQPSCERRCGPAPKVEKIQLAL